MKKLLAVLVCALVSGCATTRDPAEAQAIDDEISEAMIAYRNCVRDAVTSLAKAPGSPTEVVTAAEGICGSEMIDMQHSMAKGFQFNVPSMSPATAMNHAIRSSDSAVSDLRKIMLGVVLGMRSRAE